MMARCHVILKDKKIGRPAQILEVAAELRLPVFSHTKYNLCLFYQIA